MTIAERRYYDQRAPEYDDFYLGTGLYARRDRPGWHEEVAQIVSVVSRISAGAVVDVACGTGFLTRHLRGSVTAVDQSLAMLRVARQRLPQARIVQADALALPFAAHRFESLVVGHFYGHLREPSRARFLTEARRVASRLVIIDAGRHAFDPRGRPAEEVEEQVQERVLSDGSRHTVYKRYFTPAQLISELGGGVTLHAGRWFVALEA